MYIKQLEMNGFKSFADRTRVSFVSGINTIVGPNGCGKSNIVDAVRWVLGEQKYSILRSKGMDEVVFAGTTKRKPVGMAQVSLVFDNTDRAIPVDEDEVSLVRRIYRDGAGQYLLNGKSVRLKDFQELIADTGIGSGALFILSNQEIDRVLSPNSQERRAILEETAGINKYQIRKKETLRKLQSTKENITRLNDILAEVERQMEFSGKQLKKLEKYRKAKEHLSRQEIILLKFDLKEIDRMEESLIASISSLEKEKRDALKRIEGIRFELSSLESERAKNAVETDGAREAFSKASLEDEKLHGSSDLIREKIRQAEASLDSYKNDLERTKGRIGSIEARVNENAANLDKAEKSRSMLLERFEEIDRAFQKKESVFSEIKNEIDSARRDLASLTEKFNLLSLRAEHANQTIRSSSVEKEKHSARIEKMLDDMDEAGRKFGEWEKKHLELASRKEELEKNKKDAEKQKYELKEEAQAVYKKIQELKDKLREARSELSILMREEENFRGFSPAFQSIMKRRDSLPPLTPVHTVIRVETEYENAIDVVLGSHFQSIITENKADAAECVEILKRERLGRLTFFPMDLDRREQAMPALPRGFQGIVGWAKDLIDTEPRYREIIDMICGKTLVVRDLDSAYRIYDQQKKNREFLPRMVTLEGDVLDFSGAVTGGRFNTDRSQILSRTRKREDLEKKSKDLLEWLTKSEARLGAFSEKQQACEKKFNEVSKEHDRAEREMRDIGSQLQIFKTMRERADEDFSRMDETGREIDEKIKSGQANLEKINSEIEAVKIEISAKEAGVKEIEAKNSHYFAEMEDLRKNRDSHKAQVEEKQNLISVLQSKVKSDGDYLEENRRDLEQITENISRKEKEIKDENGLLQENSNRSSILRLKLKSFERALESSKETLAKTEKSLEDARNRLSEAEMAKLTIDDSSNRKNIEKIEIDSRRRYFSDRLNEFPAEMVKGIKDVPKPRSEILLDAESARNRLSSFESVNFSAEDEYNEHKRRYDYLNGQIEDLTEGSRGLKNIIKEMDVASLDALESTMSLLNERFSAIFLKIFGGGNARVFFTEPDNKLESGIDIEVQPPGKRTSNMGLLSTGEKSLTAVTFLFALLSIKPGPFVMLDELDAPLDDTNVEKIAGLVREFSENSQFLVVTHNRKTMEFSDTLMGITMEEPGVSKVVAVKFEDVDEFTKDKEK